METAQEKKLKDFILEKKYENLRFVYNTQFFLYMVFKIK